MDWAGETAARCIMEWAAKYPDHRFGALPVSVVAAALRKARAAGLRDAAKMTRDDALHSALIARAERIERGEDA